MSQLVTIYGGSGFVGRYIARRMAQLGWRVRVAVRRPNEAIFVKTYGVVGQVEPILCNIRDDASVAQAMAGADAVVNCVGILAQDGKNTFDAVQAQGAGRVARAAQQAGITNFVQISAIGSDASSDSDYARTKAEGEAAVLAAVPTASILRPSIIFGPEDAFFNRFAGMTRLSPAIPLVGADTKFQPVYVEDVARAAELVLTGQAEAGTYELGGPDVSSFRDLMAQMLQVVRRSRLILPLPFWLGAFMGWASELVQALSLGLVPAQITRDQVKNLRADNVVSGDTKGFADLGITPVSLEAVLPEYLWRFRPSGQYEAIKESAKNLR
ncbi:MAG: complex I NDUFA9 subunit family protein [Rhodobacteraceae bacterium]|nr:complex I NDUFA9 subunit family protein [Paracoccaceae bacterium]